MRKTLATLLCAGSIVAVGVPTTHAEDADDPWFTPTPDSTSATAVVDNPTTDHYSSPDAESTLEASRMSANPANCRTTALRPNESRHFPGTINAGVQQKCPVAVAKNSVEAKLWEHRWWGYNVIDGPEYSNLATRKKSTVYVNDHCRNNSIRVTGYGHYEWAGVHVRSAEVSKTVDIDC